MVFGAVMFEIAAALVVRAVMAQGYFFHQYGCQHDQQTVVNLSEHFHGLSESLWQVAVVADQKTAPNENYLVTAVVEDCQTAEPSGWELNDLDDCFGTYLGGADLAVIHAGLEFLALWSEMYSKKCTKNPNTFLV